MFFNLIHKVNDKNCIRLIYGNKRLLFDTATIRLKQVVSAFAVAVVLVKSCHPT